MSSTLDLYEVRKIIREFLESVGSEVMLYEGNLTPSTKSSTYRQDILESDFIIFLFAEKYGSLTDAKKSGTHEEWDLALSSNIPKHVYVKQNADHKKNTSLNKFLKQEVQAKYISFYYYKDVEDLINQIKTTVFTIARDISLNKIDSKYLPKEKILSLVATHDYREALIFIRSFEELMSCVQRYNISLTDTTILNEFMMYFSANVEKEKDILIDRMLNESYFKVIEKYKNFYNAQKINYTTSYMGRSLRLEKLNFDLSYKELKAHSNIEHKQIAKHLKEFIAYYDYFKSDVFERKAYLDSKYEF